MTIVCATDFSEQGRAAADLATSLARQLGDGLLLVHALDLAPLGIGATPLTPDNWLGQLRDGVAFQLDRERDRLRATGVAVEARVLVGRAVEQILALVKAEPPRLLVVGSHGRKGTAELFLGSVAKALGRGAPCPVVVTRGLSYPQEGLTGRQRLRLLVLCDGTPAAEAALAWVKQLRRQVACDVTFLQGYWPRSEEERFGFHEPEVSDPGQYQPALRPLLERELRRWVGPLPGAGTVDFRLRALYREVRDELAAEAEFLQPDLVVVGIAQRTFAGAHSTFTASSALESLKLAVVCVPEALRPPVDGRIPEIRTVLVGTDLSPFANQAIPAAYALITAGGGQVVLCHVFETAGGSVTLAAAIPPPSLEPGLKADIEAKLAALVPPEAAARGIDTFVEVRAANTAAQGLREAAERCDADVLVVASHGRRGLSRAVMGSVAEDLTRRTTRPVLVIHPPER